MGTNTNHTNNNENKLAGEKRGNYKIKNGRVVRKNAKGRLVRKDALGKTKK